MGPALRRGDGPDAGGDVGGDAGVAPGRQGTVMPERHAENRPGVDPGDAMQTVRGNGRAVAAAAQDGPVVPQGQKEAGAGGEPDDVAGVPPVAHQLAEPGHALKRAVEAKHEGVAQRPGRGEGRRRAFVSRLGGLAGAGVRPHARQAAVVVERDAVRVASVDRRHAGRGPGVPGRPDVRRAVPHDEVVFVTRRGRRRPTRGGAGPGGAVPNPRMADAGLHKPGGHHDAGFGVLELVGL